MIGMMVAVKNLALSKKVRFSCVRYKILGPAIHKGYPSGRFVGKWIIRPRTSMAIHTGNARFIQVRVTRRYNTLSPVCEHVCIVMGWCVCARARVF